MNPDIEVYLSGGRIPWSKGYKPYRMGLLHAAVKDPALLALFRDGSALSAGYGFGVDERIVEYPWVLARLSIAAGRLFDAGSTLNYPYLMDLPQVAPKKTVILTLAPENQEKRANISYVYDDLRALPFRDDGFDEIVCISTLEHVGLDNTRIYTSDTTFREQSTDGYGQVLRELRRVLRPGGQLLLTVPFGCAQNIGWMQQFDSAGLAEIIRCFGVAPVEKTFFRHGQGGWERVEEAACVGLEYFNVHDAKAPSPDRAAAARAVACLRFVKPVPITPPAEKACGLSVVIGSYNRLPFLKQTIASVRESQIDRPFEIIVVEGGSTDGSVEWLLTQRDILTIVQHNRGEFRGKLLERKSWGYFMNLGFKAARAPVILMLSDDCLLLPGAVSQGLARLAEAEAGGRRVGGVAFYFRNWPADPEYYVQFTLGGNLFVNHGLYTRAALEAVGFIDELNYQFYKADGDLGLRMHAAGFEVIDAPGSFVEHYSSEEEQVRQSNNAALAQDRVAYLERWKGVHYFPDQPDPRKRQTSPFKDPAGTADRVFKSVLAQFVKFPRTEEKWTRWIRDSRPNLPDWGKLIEADRARWDDARGRAATGPKILVATSVPGFAAQSMVESILAVALTLRGAAVTFLTCDQVLPACMRAERTEVDSATLADGHFNDHRLCHECPQVGRVLYGPLGLPGVVYGQLVNLQERAEISRLAREVPFRSIPAWTWRGLPVGEHAHAGTLRYFASGNLEHEPDAEAVSRRYLEGALISAAGMMRLLDQHKFATAVFHHGIYSPQGMVAAVCRATGISPKIWHIAYRKSSFMVSHDDTYHRTMLTEPTGTWTSLPWNERMETELMDYLKSRWQGTQDWIWFHEKPEENIERICAQIGVDLRKPTIGLLTNVMWDAQLHYGTNAFPDMLSWVLASIEHFARRPDLQLLIRVHPAEVRGTMKSRQPIIAEIERRWPKLPANVFIIPPESQVSTYAAMLQCDAVAIYATKTGVELAAMGVPVIVAGEAWIRNKGFSLDASSPAEYEAILSRLPLGRRLDPGQLLLAKKYAYHFFFRRMIPLRFMQPAGDWPPYRLAIDNLSGLLPGADPGLDLICDGILNGRPFVYPAETLGR